MSYIKNLLFFLMLLSLFFVTGCTNDIVIEEPTIPTPVVTPSPPPIIEPPADPPAPQEPIDIDTGILFTNAPAIRTFDLIAVEFATAMGVGWNLGNALDAFNAGRASETAWNNSTIQPGLFPALRKAGFTNVRIPVTYIGRVDSVADGYENFYIHTDWLNRVEEVVNYALDADLYVTINIHHDGGNNFRGGAWLSVEEYPHNLHPNWQNSGLDIELNQEYIRARFAAMWEQIATRFKNYDARLVFEGLNELRELNNYSNPVGSYSMENLNILNQIFVDTVRATGGNNAYRYLVAAGYLTQPHITSNPALGFRMPTDTVPYRLMLSIHYYDPWHFALNTENLDVFRWGQEIDNLRLPLNNDTWGNEPHARNTFQVLYDVFVSQGYPILLGEFGVHDKSDIDVVNHEYRRYWLEYKTRAMLEIGGFVPIYWDNGNGRGEGFERFQIFHRTQFRPVYEDIVFALVRAPYSTSRPLFSPQVIEESFAQFTYDPYVRNLFLTAVDAATQFRDNITIQTLYSVETAYRELILATMW